MDKSASEAHDPQAVVEHLLKLKQASKSFSGYIAMRHPLFVLPPFQQRFIAILDWFERGELYRWRLDGKDEPTTNDDDDIIYNLLVNMPPRHAKTTFGTIEFPVYYMGRDPKRFSMTASYNDDLAAEFGAQQLEIAQDPLVKQAFPHMRVSREKRSSDMWKTTAGGAAFAIGQKGTVTGRPANLQVYDDPIRDREQANSLVIREKVWNFYIQSLDSRLQPTHKGEHWLRLVTLTRWHPDDVGGRIQKLDEWKDGLWGHLNFQAITKKKTKRVLRSHLDPNDARYLPPDRLPHVSKNKREVWEEEEKALWPERFPLDELKRKQKLDPRAFASLYQQTPYIEGGNILKLEWWRKYTGRPRLDDFLSLILAADTSFKAGEDNDPSVIQAWGLHRNGDIYFLDQVRGKWEFPELKRRAISANAVWRGRGLRGFYVEDKASGQSLIPELKTESGISVIPYRIGTSDKTARVHAITPLIEGGRVWIPGDQPWVDEFVEECSAFPGSTHDDQVDGMVIALNVLSKIHIQPDVSNGIDFSPSNSLNSIAGRNRSAAEAFTGAFDTYQKQIQDMTKKWKGWGE